MYCSPNVDFITVIVLITLVLINVKANLTGLVTLVRKKNNHRKHYRLVTREWDPRKQ